MKNLIIIGVSLLIIVVIGWGLFAFSRTTSVTTSTINTPSSPLSNPTSTETTSRYQPFTPAILQSSQDTRRVLFFYASWCPTCRPADQDFQQHNDQIPEDVTVIRVNYNDPDTEADEVQLAKQYGITYQHTYVQIDNQGNPITQWNGGQLSELLSHIQ